MTFGERVRELTGTRGPLCVGIDPHPGLLSAWGLPDDAGGLESFAMTVAEALAGQVAVLKPQAAFFERHGSRGIAVLERVVAAIRAGGALSIVDAKRGDIGSTMTAYAQAYAGAGSPLAGDAVTASPYLGFGSLQPLLDVAQESGRGVFVLALTSNPEGACVQHARTADGRTVAQAVIDAAAAQNAADRAAGRLGSVGLVVGATVTGQGREHDLDGLNGPILAPGVGAQGGTAQDMRRVFGSALGDVLPSTSRAVLSAGPGVQDLRDAAGRTMEDLLAGFA